MWDNELPRDRDLDPRILENLRREQMRRFVGFAWFVGMLLISVWAAGGPRIT